MELTSKQSTADTAPAGWDFAHHQELLEPLDVLIYSYHIGDDICKERKGVWDIPTLASHLCAKIPSIPNIFEDEEDFETKVDKLTATVSAALPKKESTFFDCDADNTRLRQKGHKP